MQPFWTGFFHLATWISVSSMSFRGLTTRFFLAPDSILLSWCATVYPFTYWGRLSLLFFFNWTFYHDHLSLSLKILQNTIFWWFYNTILAVPRFNHRFSCWAWTNVVFLRGQSQWHTCDGFSVHVCRLETQPSEAGLCGGAQDVAYSARW